MASLKLLVQQTFLGVEEKSKFNINAGFKINTIQDFILWNLIAFHFWPKLNMQKKYLDRHVEYLQLNWNC